VSFITFEVLAYSVAVPAIIGLLYFNRMGALKPIVLLALFSLVFETISLVAILIHKNNIFYHNLFIGVDLILTVLFLIKLIRSKLVRLIISIASGLICVVLAFTIYSSESFASLPFNLSNGLIVISIVYIFTKVAAGMEIKRTVFYICGALLFYHAANSAYFASFNYLDNGSLVFAASVHSIINAICNVLTGIVLWKQSR
jgi:hypothetical protein